MTQIAIPLGKEAGVPYGYLAYAPEGATKLLISLHGHGERGNGKDQLDRLNRNAAVKLINNGKWTRTEFIVISPQYPETASMAYHTTLNKFIIKMCEKFGVDLFDVYLIGLSGGANSIYAYITNHFHIKAAVCISGAGSYKLAHQAIETKLWSLHGEKDTKIKYNGAKLFVDNYNKALPDVPAKFTLFPFEGHTAYCWETTYAQNDIYNWMLQ